MPPALSPGPLAPGPLLGRQRLVVDHAEQRQRIGDEPLVAGGHVEHPQAVDRIVAPSAAREHDALPVGRHDDVARLAEREALGPGVLAGEGVTHGAAPYRSVVHPGGRRNHSRAPLVGATPTPTSPPIASTSSRTIARPRPLLASRRCGLRTGGVEALEHVRQIAGVDARAVVVDGHRRVGSDGDDHLEAGVGQRVLDEVGGHLSEPVGIGRSPHGLTMSLHLQLHVALGRIGQEAGHGRGGRGAAGRGGSGGARSCGSAAWPGRAGRRRAAPAGVTRTG